MTDPSKARLDVDRAARAEALLRNELLNEAFGTIEANLLKAWRESPADDWKGREELFKYLRTLDSVRKHFTRVVEDGVIAAHDLKFLAEK